MSDTPAEQPEIDLAVVVGEFVARSEAIDQLAAVLARYVVLTRHAHGCRNVDLLSSATEAGRFLVIGKWDTPDAARSHLDDPTTVEMAEAAVPLLGARPRIELLETVTAHDLI